MQFQRLKPIELEIRRWRKRRDHIVCELLANDHSLLRGEALRIAHEKVGPMPSKSSRKRSKSRLRRH